MKLDRLTYRDLWVMWRMLEERHGAYMYATALWGDVLVEMHRRGWIAVNLPGDLT